MAMTQKEHHAICAVIKALSVPRNRFGKLDGDHASSNDLTDIVRLTPGIPHGGVDRIDQAMMVLQSIVGQKPTSILEIVDQTTRDAGGRLRWEPVAGRGKTGVDETADFHLVKGGGGRLRVVMRRTKRAARPFDLTWNGDHLGEFSTMDEAKTVAQAKVDDMGGLT